MVKNYLQSIEYEIPDNRKFLIPYINAVFDFWEQTKNLDLMPIFLKEKFFNMFLKDNGNELYYDIFGIKILNSPGLCYNNMFYNFFAHLIGIPLHKTNFYYSGDFFSTPEVPKDIFVERYNDLDVIDIGCNDGGFSIAANFYGAKNIYAFEVSPSSYEIATKNFELNKISINSLNIGITDIPERKYSGEKLFGIFNDSQHSEPFELREITAHDKVKDFITKSIISVKTNSLDRIFQDNYDEFYYNTGPLLISCDMNGSELKCFNGAKEILYSRKPIVSSKAMCINDRLQITKIMKSIDKKYKICNRGEFIFFYI